MVIPSGTGVSRPAGAELSSCSAHIKEDGPSTAICQQKEGERERMVGGGAEERWWAVIYSLYHKEFYGSDL